MTTFEFVFSLFGLLLGLSLAQVLGGFARSLHTKGVGAVGWQSSLLGLLVMLDLTSFWLIAWAVRDTLSATYRTLVVGLFISGLYYLAASMIFPDDEQKETSLDGHYTRVKAKVLGALLLCNCAAYAAVSVARPLSISTFQIVHIAVFGIVAVTVIFVQNKAANIALLALMCGMYLATTL